MSINQSINLFVKRRLPLVPVRQMSIEQSMNKKIICVATVEWTMYYKLYVYQTPENYMTYFAPFLSILLLRTTER